LVVVSPLTRTLRTATIALGAEQPALPFVANPDIQETFPLPCDTGSPVSAVAPLFPHVDFTGVPEDYFDAGKTDAEGYRLAEKREITFNEYSKKNLQKYLPGIGDEALLAVKNMLKISSQKRGNASDILQTPFFKGAN
jgi:hypothetical protein